VGADANHGGSNKNAYYDKFNKGKPRSRQSIWYPKKDQFKL